LKGNICVFIQVIAGMPDSADDRGMMSGRLIVPIVSLKYNYNAATERNVTIFGICNQKSIELPVESSYNAAMQH